MERNGFQCVGSCEIAEYPRIIYERHFGDRPELDACKLDAGRLPDFDVLTAGFPCQAFSTAGKRLGFEDTRGTLFFEIARIARQKRPSLLFLENVEGLLFHEYGRTFGIMLITLDELGYDVEWQVINGKYFLPQSRPRVFIIAHLRGEPFKQVFPIGEYAGEDETDGGEKLVASPINFQHKAGDGTTTRKRKLTSIAPALQAQAGHNQQPYVLMMAHTKANIKKRVRQDGTVWTVDTSSQKQALYDNAVFRRFTPLECERLMGFPDGWTEGIPERARYHCLGNAVMPPVIDYIAKQFR